MIPIKLGRDSKTQENVFIDLEQLRGHTHLIGATGAGKSVLIVTAIIRMLLSTSPKYSLFLIDPMGGLSETLLNWFAHPQFCTDDIRSRLVYVEPARTEFLMPFNPLSFSNEDDLYFNTGRTVEVIQRAWASQDTEAMPRFRQWLFNSLFSVARMGLSPAAAEFLLRPGTVQHEQLLRQIPERLRMIWAEVLGGNTHMKMQLLESTRNRTAPFFDCRIVQLMLSQPQSRFDVARFIRERKIVIINLNQKGILDQHICKTLGGMYVNELISQVRSLPPEVVSPTVLCLDEFQNFVGPDMYFALPELRQRGLMLMLSHQSLSQLERGDVDMTDIIWQCRNRFMFANDSTDADEIAHELASQSYDPKKLKEELKTFRQKKIGQHKEWLRNFNSTDTKSTSKDKNRSTSIGNNSSKSKPDSGEEGNSISGSSSGEVHGESEKDSHSSGHSAGGSETFVDDLEDFYEVSSRSYYTFDEQMRMWARHVRQLTTGNAICKLRNDPRLHHLAVEMISFPVTPMIEDLKAKLLEENFQQDMFLPREKAEADWNEVVENLGQGRLPTTIDGSAKRIEDSRQNDDQADAGDSVFR